MGRVDDEVREAVSQVVNNGELCVQALIVLYVTDDEGDNWIKLRATDMPWWSLIGLFEGGKSMVDIEDPDRGE